MSDWVGTLTTPLQKSTYDGVRTPIINTLADAYGLLRFLQIHPWHNWERFNSHVYKHEQSDRTSRTSSRLHMKLTGLRAQARLATSNLREIFATMCIRRKKDSVCVSCNIYDSRLTLCDSC